MRYEYWFACVKQLSDRKKYVLRKEFGSGKCIYYIEETRLRKSKILSEKEIGAIIRARNIGSLDRDFEELNKKEIKFIPWFLQEFPGRLADIDDPPYALYVKGRLPAGERKTIAIVGARNCTPYGEKYAVHFGEELARHGVGIISGLARGIDGAGQRGALMAKGDTFAVLGCGTDVCYPREHIGLYVDILEQGGGILSEFPPGTAPLAQNFPRRNRIISGLADVVLIMEARKKSGSLITADMALEQGRDVYALPGPINSSLSEGCNQLIRQGAGILLSPEMLLEELGVSWISMDTKKDKNKKVLESPENMVYSRLDLYPKNISQLLEETALPAEKVTALLVSLEIQGYIKEISKNYYIKIK